MTFVAGAPSATPLRVEGYAPLRDYAVVGDGRTIALVAADGSVDWLAWPNLDSPSVFGAVLDAERGGRFALRPAVPYQASRGYVPDSNVLRTRYTTADGVVQVTDALTLSGDSSLTPGRELARRIEGLSGVVPLEWSVEPRFGYGAHTATIKVRAGVPMASHRGEAIAVSTWGVGEPRCQAGAISGQVSIGAGHRALIAVTYSGQEPLVLPVRDECEDRLDHSVQVWRRWARRCAYAGPWRDAVARSALVLKTLVFAPSAALAAAGACSLPEQLGGVRNWDYRYCWIRDSAFTVDAFLQLGWADEATGYFWWLMQASQLTHPRLRVLYRLDGGPHTPELTLPLSGYRGSAPVRVGNAAAGQLQLDTYGELMQTAWLYAAGVNRLDRDVGRRLAQIADYVSRWWRQPDEGIWEVRSREQHFTQSKMMCWVALDRALDLARRGLIPGRGAQRWRREQDAITEFIETRCFDSRLNSYVRFPGTTDLDASLLLGIVHGYQPPDPGRLDGVVEAVQRELRRGPYVYRYTGGDGLPGDEGAFLACSFWLVEALARRGRTSEAAALMDQLVGLANDVGLYSEEIDPATGEFLGNLPQGLSHLSLISAAHAIAAAEGGSA